MSDGTKTGKRVKSLVDGRIDLTYNRTYDVFRDNEGDKFIIDDVGEMHYISIDKPNFYELIDDTINTTNETDDGTKPKFKVGDKVKVVNIYYISQYTDNVNVGDTGITGVIISIDDNDNITPYLVKFEDSNVRDNWWFTDKCIELVVDDSNTIENENTPIKSDGTKSNYTKTGKKVKSIYDGRDDLTYNEVYDVFIDNKGDEFIIDDIGDKRYWSISDDDYYELVDDTVNANDETKPKFKVGDKVKIVDIDYISQYTSDMRVGDVGVITCVGSNHAISSYRVEFVEFDDVCWWFTDKCIELVGDTVDTVNGNNTTDKKYNPLVVQQSGSHYKNGKIQPIEYSERNNLSMCQGNIVKYITRHKEKNGVDDLAKVVHYALLEALFVYGEDGATELRDKIDSLINIENKE